MKKKSNLHFAYPPNLEQLDLATLVSMYRSRGEIKKAEPGQYLGCALTKKLTKNVKCWFGLTYSQEGWNELLTKNSGGYPFTEAELTILGMSLAFEENGLVSRTYAEKHSGVLPKLAFMIINDLIEFGFLTEKEENSLKITPAGLQALHGICKRIYNRRFKDEMLLISREEDQPDIEKATKKDSTREQTSLF